MMSTEDSKKPSRKERFGLDRDMASRANQVEHANKKAALDHAIREYFDIPIEDHGLTGLHARFQALPTHERSRINARADEIFAELQAPYLAQLRQHKKDQNKQIYGRLTEFNRAAKVAGSGHKRRNEIFPTKLAYELYLGSEEWKVVRQRVRDRAAGRCELCGNPGSQVHHLLYNQPGTELDGHLIFVCFVCHKKAHGTYKTRRAKEQG